jgi:hypothetical protein
MATIVVTRHDPDSRQSGFRATMQHHPSVFCDGESGAGVIGALMRIEHEELGISERDLQLMPGVHWDEMTDVEIGLLVKQQSLCTIVWPE